MRQDLLDGAQSAMLKGEASDRSLWTTDFARFLRGDQLGQVCRGAGLPPLVADAQLRATALRFQVADSTPRDRRLEVRRKPAHRAGSAYLHAMELLGTGFGKMTVGPDYDAGTDPVHLHEHWTFGWSALVEARLIECAAFGDTLPAACATKLMLDYDALATEGRRGDLPQRCRLLAHGLLAGLGAELVPLTARLGKDISATIDFAALAETLRRLNLIARTAGPLRAPVSLNVPELIVTAFDRLVWLVDGLAGLSKDDLPGVIDALRLVTALVSGHGGTRLDAGCFASALDRLAATDAPPSLLGAILGLGVQAGSRAETDLAAAVSGGFRGMDLGEGRGAFLTGLLRAAPAILCRNGPLMDSIDGFLTGIDERQFMDILPELRHAFSTLTAPEAGRLAAHIARRHGHGPSPESPDPAEVVSTEVAIRTVLDELKAEGLTDWLALAAGENR